MAFDARAAALGAEVLTVLPGHTFDSVALVPVCTNELLLGVVTAAGSSGWYLRSGSLASS